MKRSLSAAILGLTCMTAYASDAPQSGGPTRAEQLERGKQIASSVCVACHGIDGMSPIPANPNLAGMPEQYIAAQLALFQSGTRKNAIMQGMAAALKPEDMRAVGAYYFSQAYKANALARNAALAETGKRIYRAGIPERKVPACAGCHGGAGAGIPALYPRLAGQWPEYTSAQLGLYASGERAHAVMQPIASRMLPADRDAVAEFIAGMRAR